MKKCRKLEEHEIQAIQAYIKESCDLIESRRAQAVLLLNTGMSREMIAILTLLSERSAMRQRQMFFKKGLDAFTNNRKKQYRKLLKKNEQAEIIKLLRETTPLHHGYAAPVWSTLILAHLIKDKYGVEYRSKKPVYLIFKEAKMSFRKPGLVYERRSEERVQEWKKEQTPILKNLWEEANTVVLCGDEMILSSKTTTQRVWLPINQEPKIECSNVRKNKSIYGFLNVKTGEALAYQTPVQNMYVTADILAQVRAHYPTQKIVIFWDGAGWHRGSVVRKFIDQDANMETIYFPTYSPEENPQEHIWRAARSNVSHNRKIADIGELANQFIDYIRSTKFPYALLGLAAK